MIIASVVCILTMIKLNITHIKYADVCRKTGISISSVFYQVKYNIFERLNIGGFQGFKTSRNLVEDLLGTTV